MKKVYAGKWTLAITFILLGSSILWNMYGAPKIAIGDFYPLVFIFLGLELILKALIRKERKVSLEGGTVILLVVIMIVVNVLPFSFLGPRSRDLFSEEHPVGEFLRELSQGNMVINFEGIGRFNTTYEIRETFPVAGIDGIKLENAFGDVSMESREGEEIEVIIEVQSNNEDQDYVKGLEEDLFFAEMEPEGWMVWTSNNRRYLEEDKVNSLRMNYRIYLPEDNFLSFLEINNEFGDVTVQGVEGGVTINNRHGDVKVANNSETLEVKNSFGDVTLGSLRGRGEIENRHGDVTLENEEAVVRELLIENEFGDVDLRFSPEQKGSFDLQTTFGEITHNLEGVEGGFEDSGLNERIFYGEVEGEEGAIVVSNRHGDIQIERSTD
ncbi:DUF4097 family beta strand repeat-containing protein [Isachenkonia alkalipeptolytica]|uniref:DUF4097 domain-containing protein n=1 Tax=Isachenkonia alkalipeptolytica TaxID=2565777 RepID=A0AA43XHD7_9CLOT|nr:DUF4097 domain-containing protein [Isachenkonia alkalipeptolytica]